MSILIGIALAIAVGLSASWVGLDRDRAMYPLVMIVIAAYYVLFALIGGSGEALLAEVLIALAFVAAAVAGFKRSLWLVVAALAAHGLMDIVHGAFVANPGVPTWWPPFCAAYDLVAAAYLAVLLARRRINRLSSSLPTRRQFSWRLAHEEIGGLQRGQRSIRPSG